MDNEETPVLLDLNKPMLAIGYDLMAQQQAEQQRQAQREHYKKVTGNKRVRHGRNQPCICESGKKYKKCCDPSKPRRQPKARLQPSIIDLEHQANEDPVATADAMIRAGIHPAIVYAFKKTGIFMTHANVASHSTEDVKLWQDAVEEYQVEYGNESEDVKESDTSGTPTEQIDGGDDAAGEECESSDRTDQ
jgi:hypothetical protein